MNWRGELIGLAGALVLLTWLALLIVWSAP